MNPTHPNQHHSYGSPAANFTAYDDHRMASSRRQAEGHQEQSFQNQRKTYQRLNKYATPFVPRQQHPSVLPSALLQSPAGTDNEQMKLLESANLVFATGKKRHFKFGGIYCSANDNHKNTAKSIEPFDEDVGNINERIANAKLRKQREKAGIKEIKQRQEKLALDKKYIRARVPHNDAIADEQKWWDIKRQDMIDWKDIKIQDRVEEPLCTHKICIEYIAQMKRYEISMKRLRQMEFEKRLKTMDLADALFIFLDGSLDEIDLKHAFFVDEGAHVRSAIAQCQLRGDCVDLAGLFDPLSNHKDGINCMYDAVFDPIRPKGVEDWVKAVAIPAEPLSS